jgi:hypothetical protein
MTRPFCTITTARVRREGMGPGSAKASSSAVLTAAGSSGAAGAPAGAGHGVRTVARIAPGTGSPRAARSRGAMPRASVHPSPSRNTAVRRPSPSSPLTTVPPLRSTSADASRKMPGSLAWISSSSTDWGLRPMTNTPEHTVFAT